MLRLFNFEAIKCIYSFISFLYLYVLLTSRKQLPNDAIICGL